MSAGLTFDEYVSSLSKLSGDIDPIAQTAESAEINNVASDLAAWAPFTTDSLIWWVANNADAAYVLGLVLGMSQERLRNEMRRLFGTTSIERVVRTDPDGFVKQFDTEFRVVELLNAQLTRQYTFGDVLAARAGGRVRANAAAASGRSVEDEIEQIAVDLGLPCETRTRFVGKHGLTAPCDLAIPAGSEAVIAVAAKGFDSTGSKLTDAVREIQEMAEVRLPRQFICAVIDGMGWQSRKADLKRLWELWDSDAIDGLYTLSNLDTFRADIAQQARLRGFDVRQSLFTED
jgi:hypothetical protein